MLFIPLTFSGFYFTYFSQLGLSLPSVMHMHFILMGLWMITVIAQALLIRSKKPQLHRKIGRLSYILVPLVVLSTWAMMRYSFAAQTEALTGDISLGIAGVTLEQGRIEIANFMSIAFVYLFWLVLFFGLAVGFRKNSSIHARFMIAAALTFIGPTLDRTLIFGFDLYNLGPGLPIEVVGFLLINLILLFLLIKDIKGGKSPIPYSFALGIFMLFQFLHLTITHNSVWETIVRTLLS